MGYLIVLGLVIVLVPLVIAVGLAGWRRPGKRRGGGSPIREQPADEGARAVQNSTTPSHDDQPKAR
jgi:hypothetical protein